MEKLLNAGAITQILENQKPANPVLQIIGYKPMTPDQMAFGHATEELRYRLMIGDGLRNHQYCVITNQELVDDIKKGKLEKWSIIRVTSYQTVDYGEGPPENKRRLIYILNLEIVKPGSEVGAKLTCQPGATNMPVKQETISSTTNPYNNSHRNPPMQQQSFNRPAINNQYPGAQMDTQPQPYPMNQPYNHQQDVIRSPKAMRNNHHDQAVLGIKDLTPYLGKWVIKGRVTSKSHIREYSNAKGNGKLFSFTLADKDGEIKITAFNTDCERVFDYVVLNRVYLLGRASIKPADKRYSNAEFEITLNNDSLLEEVIDKAEANEIPLARFSFVSIASLSSTVPTSPVDLIGAILDVTDVSTVISKTKNKELKKRSITIVDMSRHTIEVTIWGENADTFTGAPGDVFATKSARIGTYGGRSASAGDCIYVNLDIPEVRKMKSWYENLIDHSNFTALTSTSGSQGGGDQWSYLEQMQNLELAKVNQNPYAKCKAVLMAVGKNPVYKCCPTDNCGKKLIDTQSGDLKCEKCQQSFSTYKYRFKTDIEIEDCTSSAWVTLWDEKAEMVLKMKPDDLERYMRMENKEQYEKIITAPTFKSYIFTLRSRLDNYQGEERVKLNCVNLACVDQIGFTKRVIEDIKRMCAE